MCLQGVWGLGRAWALNVGDLLKDKTRTSDSLTGVQDVSVCVCVQPKLQRD